MWEKHGYGVGEKHGLIPKVCDSVAGAWQCGEMLQGRP